MANVVTNYTASKTKNSDLVFKRLNKLKTKQMNTQDLGLIKEVYTKQI